MEKKRKFSLFCFFSFRNFIHFFVTVGRWVIGSWGVTVKCIEVVMEVKVVVATEELGISVCLLE